MCSSEDKVQPELKKKKKKGSDKSTSTQWSSEEEKRHGSEGQQRQCHSSTLEHPGFLNPTFMLNHQMTNNISNLVSHKVSKCGPRTSSISTT